MTSPPTDNPGTVYLVGAGPGDPGLITLRGVECLALADVVLYDYLVNPVLVEHASHSAVLVRLGDPDVGRAHAPDDITARMIDEARSGRTVVRLKSGDPSVFGRGADEADALRKAGIPYEIVPGVTAGLAVAAYCEIPITHHQDASAVALVTGTERQQKVESSLDRGLAEFPGTLIFYMGVGKAASWSEALLEQGKAPETPVAIVRWCSRAEQETVRCTLGTVTDVVERRGIRPPAVFVVGGVVDRAPKISWFEARPLFGTRILVAGTQASSNKLRAGLSTLGADVTVEPAIRIADPPDWDPVDVALDKLDEYHWVVFSSGNGVDYLIQRLLNRGGDLRRLGRVKLAVVGSGTADRLAQYNLRADLVPERFNAESLAQALAGQAPGRRFLLAQANRGRDLLADVLEKAGAHVDRVVVYSSIDVEEPSPRMSSALSSGEIDWITVTSPATAKSLARLYGDGLKRARLASISPLTSAALRKSGYEPAAEASPHTTDGLVDAIRRAQDESG